MSYKKGLALYLGFFGRQCCSRIRNFREFDRRAGTRLRQLFLRALRRVAFGYPSRLTFSGCNVVRVSGTGKEFRLCSPTLVRRALAINIQPLTSQNEESISYRWGCRVNPLATYGSRPKCAAPSISRINGLWPLWTTNSRLMKTFVN